MEIGKEDKPYESEPVEDPFQQPAQEPEREAAPVEPEKPEREKVPA